MRGMGKQTFSLRGRRPTAICGLALSNSNRNVMSQEALMMDFE
jgi:hypothetical protein